MRARATRSMSSSSCTAGSRSRPDRSPTRSLRSPTGGQCHPRSLICARGEPNVKVRCPARAFSSGRIRPAKVIVVRASEMAKGPGEPPPANASALDAELMTSPSRPAPISMCERRPSACRHVARRAVSRPVLAARLARVSPLLDRVDDVNHLQFCLLIDVEMTTGEVHGEDDASTRPRRGLTMCFRRVRGRRGFRERPTRSEGAWRARSAPFLSRTQASFRAGTSTGRFF